MTNDRDLNIHLNNCDTPFGHIHAPLCIIFKIQSVFLFQEYYLVCHLTSVFSEVLILYIEIAAKNSNSK